MLYLVNTNHAKMICVLLHFSLHLVCIKNGVLGFNPDFEKYCLMCLESLEMFFLSFKIYVLFLHGHRKCWKMLMPDIALMNLMFFSSLHYFEPETK